MRKKKRVLSFSAALLSLTLLLSSTPVFAAVSTYGSWPSRYQTMYVDTSSTLTVPYSSGAAKWYNATNYKVSTSLTGTVGSYNYRAFNVTETDVDWDGITEHFVYNGEIWKEIVNINTYYTSMSRYTSAIKTALVAHEVGHSLGLLDSSVVETTSIMHPYTFNSAETATVRPMNPSASDISVVNGLYPTSSSFMKKSASGQEDGYYIHPSWAVYYANENELAEAADLVVRGTVTSEAGSKFTRGDYKSYATLSAVQATQVLKGGLKDGEQIMVSQMGGTDGSVKVFVDETTHLQKDQEVVLFLRKRADNTYSPINGDDGVYLDTKIGVKNIATKRLIDLNSMI
ncbi:hypothetical protein [Paenibacillus sp. HB172176]|uniref:hypothetical protein n=1 Tax=Paenibacillus sp. HB172176 TaxID=2493690 RepID=UPI00143B8FD0|nr:hypothetical protein [Paenibacillus sp. HB172176]